MGSTLISKARTCLKPLKPLFHHGNPGFLIASFCKSPKLPPPARSLCSSDSDPHPGGRQTHRRNSGQNDRLGGTKNSTVRHREEQLWVGMSEKRSKSFTLRQNPSFPKSVFAAGTAKRTTEMMKRKAAQASQEEEQEEEESAGRTIRGAGGRNHR